MDERRVMLVHSAALPDLIGHEDELAKVGVDVVAQHDQPRFVEMLEQMDRAKFFELTNWREPTVQDVRNAFEQGIGHYEGVRMHISPMRDLRGHGKPALAARSSDPDILAWNARVEARNRAKGKRP